MADSAGVASEVDRLADALAAALGANLHSCILYGSAVRGDFIPGASDVNLLIVLAESTPAAHAVLAREIRRVPRVEPFVLGLSGLARSQRVFALKFRSIRRNYRVLRGADVLADVAADPPLLRFLAEQSLRNVRLRHKYAYITFGHDRPRFARFNVHANAAIHAALSEALRCDGVDVPKDRLARIPVYERAFGADASVLNTLADLRAGRRTLSSDADVDDLHARLFALLSAVARWMEDRWPMPQPQP